MASDPESNPNTSDSSRPWLRSGAAFLVIALALGTLFLFLDLYGERPDLFEPARGAISDAAMILSQTYSDEQDLIDRFQTVHRQLEKVIALLDRAKRLDPADRREIETLRVRLQALENPSRMVSDDPERLKHSYHELIEQLNALADRLAAQPRS
jgi:hypothetical protein